MRYKVLGPVRATRNGDEVPLGGPQQRLVLALLLAENGRPVSTSRLIDGVWGEDEPATAKKALQGYIHHLRTQVGDALKTEGSGYSLATNGDIDAHEFERLHQQASEAQPLDPDRAASLLRDALAQWNGAPYADLGDYLSLAPEIARLEDLRVTALGDRVDADLALGRHTALVGELEALTQEYPLRERFRGQHMTALYRAGRQVEALRSFERFRRHLGEEMGLDPTPELRELEGRILSADETLKATPSSGSTDPVAVRGYELRDVVANTPSGRTYRGYQRSIGRQVSMKMLGPDIADDPEFIATFLADTKQVATLEHPHIDVVFDTWREPGAAYQVSRWFEQGSLADALAIGALPTSRAATIITDVAEALGYAHRNGVVHGHVATTNVMLDDGGRAHLADFVVGRDKSRSEQGDRLDLAVLARTLLTKPSGELNAGLEPVFEIALGDEGYGQPEHLARAIRRALGIDRGAMAPEVGRADLRNPYKGLKAFQQTDADDFYGREAVVDRIVERLEQHRLVAVVGPSGSGKSSAVKAGLLPRLHNLDDGTIRLVSEMYPGSFPFEELEDALTRVGVSRGRIEDLVSNDRGLSRVLREILPSEDTELVLVVDQFEELFSMGRDEATRQLFLDSIVSAVTDPNARVRFVLTMRADFFDRPLGYPEFGELFEKALVPLTVLSDAELEESMVAPAADVGVKFEPGLVDRVVSDVSGQPGALPLLQYALTDLFDRRDTDTLTLAAYQRSGGVLGRLGRRAEELHDELDDAGRDAIRHALLHMVTVDEGADDLRRRVRLVDLRAPAVDQSTLDQALQVFGAHRLLTFDLDPATSTPTVEVAHEALLREWPRLRTWIDEQREDLLVRRRLEAAVAEWQSGREDDSYLPGGGRLAQFAQWSSTTSLAMSPDQRRFLDAAQRQEDEAAVRAARRRRRLLVGLSAVSVLLAVAAVFSLVQRRNADETARDAETNRLAATASVVAEGNPRLGLLVAAEAYSRAETVETLGALQRTMLEVAPFTAFSNATALHLDWQADRIFLLTDDGIEVLNAQTREQTHRFEFEPGLDSSRDFEVNVDGNRIAFAASLDGAWVGAASVDGGFRLIEIDSGQAISLDLDDDVTAAAFGPHSKRLAVGDSSGTTHLIELGDLDERREIPPIDNAATAEEFGVRTAYQSNVNEIALNGGIEVGALAFSEDGATLAIAQGPRVYPVSVISGEVLAPAELTTTTDLLHGSGYAYVAQDLWFEGSDLVVKGWQTTASIDADAWAYRFKSALLGAGNLSVDFAPTVVRPISPGVQIALLPDSRVRILRVEPPAEFEGLTNVQGTVDVLDEIPLSGDVGEGFAVSPDRRSWVVATDAGLVFGSLRGTQLLAEEVGDIGRRSRDNFMGNSDRFTLLSIAQDGSVAASGQLGGLLFPRSEADPLHLRTAVRFAEVGSTEDSLLISTRVPWATLSSGEGLSDSTFLYDLRPPFAVSPDARLLGYQTCTDIGGEITGNILRCPATGLAVADVATGEIVARPTVPETAINLEWSPDGRRLVAVDEAGLVHAWDTANWQRIEDAHLQTVTGAATYRYSPDGSLAAIVKRNGSIDIVDSAGDVVHRLTGAGSSNEHSWHAEHPWFSADNRHLVTAHDGLVRLWDLTTGQPIGAPFPNDREVAVGGRSGDVPQLITAVHDDLLIWNLNTSTWFDIACLAAGRNMTPAEWDQFGPTDTDYRATCPHYPIEPEG